MSHRQTREDDFEDVEMDGESVDGLSDSEGSDGGMEDALASSHGTYFEGTNEGVEDLEDYQVGGYHPVHLGDALGPSGRYRVIHKLGHGGHSTVWLCRDKQNASYVAVKVTIAAVSPDELADLRIAQLDRRVPAAQLLAIPLDHFVVEGPNGAHQCVVLPVLGPCVSPKLWLRLEGDAGPFLRGLAQQAAQAMGYLHQNGICHGDFRPSNILVKLANLDHLSEEQILSLLGQPVKVESQTESGEPLPASAPQYLVLPADTSLLGNEYLTNQICVIDFGESYPASSPPTELGIPESYLPPEILLDEANAVGPACDLWALSCTLFEIRQQIPLFYMIFDQDELLAEMVRFFGKLPDRWWKRWDEREDFFDESGKWLGDDDEGAMEGDEKEDWSLEVALSKPIEIVQPGKNQDEMATRALITSEAEQGLMADLLYKLFQYEPSKRIGVDEVLAHDWFKM